MDFGQIEIMAKLRVAMIAPPWLSVPPDGYGGIELVVDGLTRELIKLDVCVELFSIGKSHIKGVKSHSLYKNEQYSHIHKSLYESSPIVLAHLLFALDKIANDGKFDIIHDHNGFLGPAMLRWATEMSNLPPVLHTLHGPPFSNLKALSNQGTPDNQPFWRQLANAKNLYVVGISKSLTRDAPPELKRQLLASVHNGIEVSYFQFRAKKHNHFITLARFSREKGQHIAAKLCDELGYSLKMAGTVAGIGSEKQLVLELANPLSEYRSYPDFRYYSDNVWPLTVKNPRISYVGNVGGTRKINFIGAGKALLFPIDWEEPFGMAVIEALACGTPVIAMNRGAMPEIIKHGVNGFLAKSVPEFRKYMKRVEDIDPARCRQTVEELFSTSRMAREYLSRYHQILGIKNNV